MQAGHVPPYLIGEIKAPRRRQRPIDLLTTKPCIECFFIEPTISISPKFLVDLSDDASTEFWPFPPKGNKGIAVDGNAG